MKKEKLKIILITLVIVVAGSCTTAGVNTGGQTGIQEQMPPLRVGVTTNYPPIIFRQGGKVAGVEVELARGLGAELGRRVEFIELKWSEQIPSLMAGRTDIIMSGMSITRARSIRVIFADPYLKSGLVPMMHVENIRKYDSIESIKQDVIDIGVVEGTTGEIFVRRNFPNAATISVFQKAGYAPVSLKNREIDVFIHDAPSVIWLVSENEAYLTALWEPVNEEELAWGVRKDDEPLLMKVNSILNKWKKDGTLERILLKWLPAQYLERFKE